MAAKKEQTVQLSPEEQSQVQHLFTQYHQFAERLRGSSGADEARAALTPITTQPEAVQVALFKTLAREAHSDAADILAALHALSPQKELRKEARRALLRLEGAKIHPRWQPPSEQAVAIQPRVEHAPRFWKGLVTQSREQGEMQLLLCWEQGYDYGDVRIFSFLLDFWHDGVKDVAHEVLSKRRFDDRLSRWRSSVAGGTDVRLVSCTLAEGRRLLEDALSLNNELDKAPAEEYRNLLPLINRYILQAQDLGEDRGDTFITPELEAAEVALNFIGAWSFGDFGLAYDLLTPDSDLRESLTRAEWTALRRAWHKEAHPVRMALGFVHEREAVQSALWLPSSVGSRAATRKEIELGWSLELESTPLSGTLKEMPMGTAVNKETGRHWFATSYTLARVDGAWRIQQIKDEGAALQGLPVQELQARIKEHEEAIEKLAQQRENLTSQQAIEEMAWRLTLLLHLYDALIAQLPLDYKILEQAYTYSVLAGNPERTMVYLERMAQRFAERKQDNQRRLAATLIGVAHNYDQANMQKRVRHLLERAEALLRELVSQEDNAINHALLGEFLMSEFRNDEAESEFQRALQLHPDLDYQVSIEAGLGHIAMRKEQLAEAIPHYRRVVELKPDTPGIWFALGFAQRMLGQFAEAEKSYQQAIQVDPQDPRPYTDLAAIYLNTDRKAEARATLERAIRINPGSAHLHALLASLLFELGEQRAAQRALAEAERLDPENDTVQQVRQHMRSARR